MRPIVFFLLIAAAVPAQIGAPAALGFIRDRAGALRPVHGVAGNFVLGDPLEIGVLAASFSGHLGFAKTVNALLIFEDGKLSRRIDAPDGTATFVWEQPDQLSHMRFTNTGDCVRPVDSRLETVACKADSEAPLPADAPEAVGGIEQMSRDWRVVRTESGLFAVRKETVYQLPEAAE